MAIRYTYAAGSAADWAASSLVLAVGQPGYETDTGVVRVGDGANLFPALPVQTRSPDGTVRNLRVLTQAAYSGISVPDPATLYIIVN